MVLGLSATCNTSPNKKEIKMPVTTCTGCGRLTNSATSNYWQRMEPDGKTPKEVGEVTRCYVAFEGDKTVMGCGYKALEAEDMASKKRVADKLISGEIDVADESYRRKGGGK